MSVETVPEWGARLSEALASLPATQGKTVAEWANGLRAAAVTAARSQRATGAMERSLRLEVTGSDVDSMSVTLKSDDPAAVTAENGGPIRGAPWLAIPLRDELHALPGPRSDIAMVLIVVDGKPYLGTTSGAGLDLRWALRRQVQRAASPFMGPTMRREVKPDRLGRQLADAFVDGVTRG